MLDHFSGKQVGAIARGAAPKVVAGAADVYRYFAGWPTKLTGQTMEVSTPPGLGIFFGFMADVQNSHSVPTPKKPLARASHTRKRVVASRSRSQR